MSLTYEPFDTITVSKVNEKLGGGVEKLNRELSDLENKIPKSINENLLVNGYLVNPVRTFGLTSQTVSDAIQAVLNGWTIAGSAKFLFSSSLGYVNVTSTANGTEFYNVTGGISVTKGKTYTFSMLVSGDYSGVKILSTFTNTTSTSTNYDNGIYTLTFTAENNTGYVGISIPNGTGIGIYGAKLEEGSTQTLCYKDSSGNWVQHIPNKADEFARCSQWNTINKYIGNALLPLSGGTMTGSINMGNQKITRLADGTNDVDAVNLRQLKNVLQRGTLKLRRLTAFGEQIISGLYKIYDVNYQFAQLEDESGNSYDLNQIITIIPLSVSSSVKPLTLPTMNLTYDGVLQNISWLAKDGSVPERMDIECLFASH